MANLLKAQAIGRLTRDPHSGDDKENGGVYCLLSIAVNRKSGNDEETTFIDVSVRGGQAAACADQLSQGDEIYVDGTASIREFEKKDRTLDKVLRINASTVQFLNVKKWAEGGSNGRDGYSDAPRGRGGNSNGNGRSANGRGGYNGSGNARAGNGTRTTSRY